MFSQISETHHTLAYVEALGGGGTLPKISKLDKMAWNVRSEPLVVPTRWALPVAPSTGPRRASAVGCRSHREEHQKASPCFPTTGGPRSVRHSYLRLRKIIMLSTFIVGTERTEIAEKQMLGLKIPKGKNPISLNTYEILVNTLFETKEKRDIFAHLFLVFDRSLMKVTENFANTIIKHIQLHSERLVVELVNSMVHQKVENDFCPWHVYANP